MASNLSSSNEASEKISSTSLSDVALPEKEAFESADIMPDWEANESVALLNGEPAVTTGKDVSRFVVDVRDDGDDALTFRSFVLGTVLAGLGAALCQVWHFFQTYFRVFIEMWQIYLFKPVQMGVSSVFLLLISYTLGNVWAKCLPRKTMVVGTWFEFLGPTLDFINPGPFTLKEVCFISSPLVYHLSPDL
jgi:OPT oligopeptide transporter protein